MEEPDTRYHIKICLTYEAHKEERAGNRIGQEWLGFFCRLFNARMVDDGRAVVMTYFTTAPTNISANADTKAKLCFFFFSFSLFRFYLTTPLKKLSSEEENTR